MDLRVGNAVFASVLPTVAILIQPHTVANGTYSDIPSVQGDVAAATREYDICCPSAAGICITVRPIGADIRRRTDIARQRTEQHIVRIWKEVREGVRATATADCRCQDNIVASAVEGDRYAIQPRLTRVLHPVGVGIEPHPVAE